MAAQESRAACDKNPEVKGARKALVDVTHFCLLSTYQGPVLQGAVMRGLPVVHSVELPDAVARIVYSALLRPLSGLLHPHPDGMGERDHPREMVASHAHVSRRNPHGV